MNAPSPLPVGAKPLVRFGGYEPYFLLMLCTMFWAGNIIVGRLAASHVPPLTMNCIRWFGSFLVFLPFAWRHLQADWPKLRRQWPLLIAFAATGFALNNTCTYWGLQYTEALNTLLLQSGTPLFVALWMLVLFRVRLTLAQAVGISISLIGVLTIILHGDFSALLRIQLNKGDVIVFCGVPMFGLYSALMTRRPTVHPLGLTTVLVGLAAVLLAPWRLPNSRPASC